MNLVRSALKSNRLIQSGQPNQVLASLLPRRFSTEAEPPKQFDADSFPRPPPPGLFYGKLHGITKNTTRNDIANLLEGCNLKLEDIKVNYTREFIPATVLIQFPSRSAYENAGKAIGRKGRLYKLERADQSQWQTVTSFDGKTILLQGIPRSALQDDVERFLSGCEYDANFQIFLRRAFPDSIRMALVKFPSQALAMHAFITKNQGFCLNNQIKVRVLH